MRAVGLSSPFFTPLGAKKSPYCQCMFKVTQRLKHKKVGSSLVSSELKGKDGTLESHLVGRRNGVGRTEKDHTAEELTSRESETRTRWLSRAPEPNQPAERRQGSQSTAGRRVRTVDERNPVCAPRLETAPLREEMYIHSLMVTTTCSCMP